MTANPPIDKAALHQAIMDFDNWSAPELPPIDIYGAELLVKSYLTNARAHPTPDSSLIDLAAAIAEIEAVFVVALEDRFIRVERVKEILHRHVCAKPSPDREDAYGYASRLFRLLAPECEPLPTTRGVLTQLDNYIAGLREQTMCHLCKQAKLKAYDLLGRWLLEPGKRNHEVEMATLEFLGASSPYNHDCPSEDRNLLVSEQHLPSEWQPPTAETIARWKQHEVISRRDWVGVLTMLEDRFAASGKTLDCSEDTYHFRDLTKMVPSEIRVMGDGPLGYPGGEQTAAVPSLTSPQSEDDLIQQVVNIIEAEHHYTDAATTIVALLRPESPAYGSGAVESAAERHGAEASASATYGPAQEGDALIPESAPATSGYLQTEPLPAKAELHCSSNVTATGQPDDCRELFELEAARLGLILERWSHGYYRHAATWIAWCLWNKAWDHNLPTADDVRGIMPPSERESISDRKAEMAHQEWVDEQGRRG